MSTERLMATACFLLLAASSAQTGASPLPLPSSDDSPDDSPVQKPSVMIQYSPPGFTTTRLRLNSVAASESKNGIHLTVRDDGGGPRGRLEVTAREPKFAGSAANNSSWVPVCDSAFTDQAAETMCKLLGYTYGRKYYAPGVNSRSNATSNHTAGYFSCSAKSPASSATGRRLLRNQETNHGGGTVAAVAAITRTDGGGWRQQHGGPRRRASSSVRYNLNTSTTAPYACSFSLVTCDPLGLLVGVECAYAALLPAPPPPPLPPRPPTAPPPQYSDLIRLVGGPAVGSRRVEQNLCHATSPQFCAEYSRVEMLVTLNKYGGLKTWAPLCAVDGSLAQEVARVACQQEYNWPSLKHSPPYNVTHLLPDEDPFFYTIPRAMSSGKDDFNPANVLVWATVESVRTTRDLRTLQDFNVTVSSLICKKGKLFAVSCAIGPA